MVAEKLGYTLSGMRDRMVPEELELWLVFYHLRADQEKEMIEKQRQASKRRR